jgi:hypothetical protein
MYQQAILWLRACSERVCLETDLVLKLDRYRRKETLLYLATIAALYRPVELITCVSDYLVYHPNKQCCANRPMVQKVQHPNIPSTMHVRKGKSQLPNQTPERTA